MDIQVYWDIMGYLTTPRVKICKAIAEKRDFVAWCGSFSETIRDLMLAGF